MRAVEALAAVEQLQDGSELVVRPSRVYSTAPRRCCVEGCSTILSRYNSGPDCWAHYGERTARQFEARQAQRMEAEAA